MNAHEATDTIRSLAPKGGVYPVRDWPPARRRWAVGELARHFEESEKATGVRPYIPRWLKAEMGPAPAEGEAFKSVIANAPGLIFDTMSHRWRRTDKPEAGIHLDPESRRAHVVDKEPREGMPDWLREMNDERNADHAKTAEKMNGVLDHFERGTLEFRHPGTPYHAVVIPDASEPGKWRFSEYDHRGFAGHQTHDTPHEAAAAAAAHGFTEPAPGSLDKLAATDEWAEGTRHAKATQIGNELGFAGHHEARDAMDDHYRRHGGSDEALSRIMQPHVMEALRRGEVHPELHKSLADLGEAFKAVYGHTVHPREPHDGATRHVDPLRGRNRQEHPFAGEIQIPGLPLIRVETCKGEYRRGTDRDGKDWAIRMPCHYGEFAGSEGVDGDPLDVFVGPNHHAPFVYVIHLKDPESGEYDEDKVFVGFDDKAAVIKTFAAAYNRPGFRGGLRKLTFPEFVHWLTENGKKGQKITVGEVMKAATDNPAADAIMESFNAHRARSAGSATPGGYIGQRGDWRDHLEGPTPPGHDASADEVQARLDWVKHQIAALAQPDEVAKAVARGDSQTLSMFDLMGQGTHAGLHQEQRTDRTGRTESRWIADPTTPTPPAEGLAQIGEPRARTKAPLGPTQGPKAGRMFEGLGDAPTPAEPAGSPNLADYDVILVNTSAGKDSQAMLDYVMERARAAGVADRVVGVHADLGRVEWEGTRELAEAQADHYGIRFETVSRPQGDLLQQIEERAANLAQREQDVAALGEAGIRTWAQLASASETQIAAAIGDHDAERSRKLQQAGARKAGVKGADAPIDFGKSVAWPSSAARYCTSDHKRGQVQTLITRLTAEQQAKHAGRKTKILNCMGLRADESAERAKKEPFTQDERTTKREVDDWLPIHHWTEPDVWRRIRAAGTPYHNAYDLGMSRLSCVFCVFASKHDLKIAAEHNPALFREYVDLEKRIGHKFRANMALAEIADSTEPPEVHKALAWED